MIKTLSQGRLPEAGELAHRLRLAIIKKMAIIRQPYLFWSGDPKINPPAAHILWAAVLLGDKENFQLASDILITEKIESASGISSATDPQTWRKELVNHEIEALLQVNVDKTFCLQLIKKIKAIQKTI